MHFLYQMFSVHLSVTLFQTELKNCGQDIRFLFETGTPAFISAQFEAKELAFLAVNLARIFGKKAGTI